MLNKYEKFFITSKKRLNEKTFNLDVDVNKLYELSGFNNLIDMAESGSLHQLDSKVKKLILSGEYLIYKTDTSILKSEDAKKANAINLVPIYFGIFNSSAYGIHKETEKGVIVVTLNFHAIKILLTNPGLNKENSKFRLNDKTYKNIWNSLSETRIKNSIYHELSHWASDSIHNRYMLDLVKKSKELDDRDILKLGQKDINMTHFEIDGQIHEIKNIKNTLNDEDWNTLTLPQLFIMEPSLGQIAQDIYFGEDNDEEDVESLNIWLKFLIKRMNREGLLGEKMHTFPKISELLECRGGNSLTRDIYTQFFKGETKI